MDQFRLEINKISTIKEYNRNNLVVSIKKQMREINEMEFDAKKEIASYKGPGRKYIMMRAKDDSSKTLFLKWLIVFAKEAQLRQTIKGRRRRVHVGIDYEFNQRKIALMQTNFEAIGPIGYIWLLNPSELSSQQNIILVNMLMANKNIYKILHGAESLDIPYMFSEMFGDDLNTILKFTSRFIDTRFLCEYVRLSLSQGKKCTIYEALHYFGTISNAKKLELEEVHDSMGPIQDISWNVHKISSFHLKYALYDVLFLEEYLLDIYDKIRKETPQLLETYRFIIPMIRFVILERRGVTNILEEAKKQVDLINNYMFMHRGSNIRLMDAYNKLLENLVIPNPKVDVNMLLAYNYFKKSFTMLLKLVVYSLILKNKQVYQKRDRKYDGQIEIGPFLEKLRSFGFKKIAYLINLFRNQVEKKLQITYDS